MRILITTDVVGGVWQFSQELTEGLLEQGCEVVLVALGREPSRSQAKWFNRLTAQSESNFRFENLACPLEWMQENDRAYSEAEPLLLELCRYTEPDLVHVNQYCFGALPLKIPKVITAHSDVLSWAEACRTLPLEPSAWLTRYCELVSAGLQGATAVAAPTAWMLRALQENFAVPDARYVIANGRRQPRIEKFEGRDGAITAGRLWDEAKDVQLLQAVRSPFPLRVAGESGMFHTTNVNGGLEYLGMLTQEELFLAFNASAVYICTSRYEPFGLAPLEAALCGCAVVSRDIASLREVWQDGALFFNTAEQLSALLQHLHAHPGELRAAQERSLARASLYTREKMVQSYRALYDKALHGTGAYSHVA